MITLNEYVKKTGTNYQTSVCRIKKGKLPGIKINKHWMVYEEVEEYRTPEAIIYMLESEELRLYEKDMIDYCKQQGYNIKEIVHEIGNNKDGKRPSISRILSSSDYDIIVVKDYEDISESGWEFIVNMKKASGQKIESIHGEMVIGERKISKEKMDLFKKKLAESSIPDKIEVVVEAVNKIDLSAAIERLKTNFKKIKDDEKIASSILPKRFIQPGAIVDKNTGLL